MLVLAAVHLTQGTSTIGAGDLLGLLLGSGDQDAARVLVASRLPRLAGRRVVGVALGVAGAALQSIARNPFASPDTLAVNAGAYLAVVAAASFGLRLPVLPAGLLAFVGGLAAAGLVLALSAGGRSGPTRLILAGSATALALSSLTTLLMLLFQQETIGLFAWGNGSLIQSDLDGVAQMAPVVAVATVACVLLGRRLDILGLGDDTATVLGLSVRRTRLVGDPAGRPALGRRRDPRRPDRLRRALRARPRTAVAPLVPGLHRHRLLLPMAGLVGILVVLGADVILRAVLGGQGGVDVPTGVITTIVGAGVLVWLARRLRDSGPTRQPPAARSAPLRSPRFFWAVVVAGGGGDRRRRRRRDAARRHVDARRRRA